MGWFSTTPPKPLVEMRLDTDGLRVGSKLWNAKLGWLIVRRLERAPWGRHTEGRVWVEQE